MAIKTNLTSLAPRRETYKKSIPMVSGAYYDRQAFPDGKITVFPWDSSMDEWFLKRLREPNREYAMFDVIPRIADLHGCDVKRMLPVDTKLIYTASRSIANDLTVKYTARCPKCDTGHPGVSAIPGSLRPLAQKPLDYDGKETITLPDSKDIVCFRHVTVGDEYTLNERSVEEKNAVNYMVARLLVGILTVGGEPPTDRAELYTWYMALSPKDAKYLAQQEDELLPRPDYEVPFVCDTCGHAFKFRLDLDESFFRVGF